MFIAWSRRNFFSHLLLNLFFLSIVIPVQAGSNFIRVQLGKGSSIEIPKNWVVLSGNKRTTIDTYVEAMGFRQTESTLNFAANLYDDRGKTLALVNARFYPDNPFTQTEARLVTSEVIKEFDVEFRRVTETTLKAVGIKLLNWYGSQMQVINGLHVLVHEHRTSGASGAGVERVCGLRIWRSPRSFTVTIAYRESEEKMLRPIIDYMSNSIQQD